MPEPMRWIKERILEYEWKDPSYTETVHRIHLRLRSDGSLWYQVSRRGGLYDRYPDMLEARFSDYLRHDPARYDAHAGYTEKDFDDDFLERLHALNGKEVTPVSQ